MTNSKKQKPQNQIAIMKEEDRYQEQRQADVKKIRMPEEADNWNVLRPFRFNKKKKINMLNTHTISFIATK